MFLVPNKSLNQQDVDFLDEFIFTTRLFIPSPPFSKQNDYLSFMFNESHNYIINGEWAVEKIQAIKLASMELQYKYGDFNARIHTHSFFDRRQLQLLLPEQWRLPQIIPDIVKEYKHLSGIPPSDASYRYVESVRKLQTYGDTIFDVRVDNNNDILTINSSFVCHYEAETWKLISEMQLTDIKTCSVDTKGETLILEQIDGDFTCYSRDALVIERLVLDYIEFANKKKNKQPIAQKQDEKCSVM